MHGVHYGWDPVARGEIKKRKQNQNLKVPGGLSLTGFLIFLQESGANTPTPFNDREANGAVTTFALRLI